MATALITGASGGIGMELARIHAGKGDDLVLVARNRSGLENLKKELEQEKPVRIYLIVQDLSEPDAALKVCEATKSLGITIDYLVNNAGFGDFGFFHEASWSKTEQMIALNITALTQLTHLYLPEMVKRGHGRILNLASAASFQPGPLMAVYYASKAYVLHFTEAIANEVQGSGVTVTALCPGPTESGFQGAAAMEESALVKGKKLPASREVALFGYKAMMQGRKVAIHGSRNALFARLVGIVPRALVVSLTRKIQEKR